MNESGRGSGRGSDAGRPSTTRDHQYRRSSPGLLKELFGLLQADVIDAAEHEVFKAEATRGE
ncbi:hypothetical protein OAV42_01195 [Ilumatobacter sp.]|nr:hypothetical protein [Ilumatobacter sp.]